MIKSGIIRQLKSNGGKFFLARLAINFSVLRNLTEIIGTLTTFTVHRNIDIFDKTLQFSNFFKRQCGALISVNDAFYR